MLIVAFDKSEVGEKPGSIAVSPSGDRIATQNEKGEVRVYDLKQWKPRVLTKDFGFAANESTYRYQSQLEFVNDDRIAISRNHWCTEDGSEVDPQFPGFVELKLTQQCEIWDLLRKRNFDRDFFVADSAYHVIAGSRMARIHSTNREIEIVDLNTGDVISKLTPGDIALPENRKDDAYASVFMRLNEDGSKLFIAYYTGGSWSPGAFYQFGPGQVRMDVFETMTGLQVASTTVDYLRFQISQTGNFMLAIQDGRIVLLDRYLETVCNFGKPNQPGFQFKFSPDETMFAQFTEGDLSIDIYQVQGKKVLSRIPASGASRFVFSRDNTQLIVFSENRDKGLEFWNVKTAVVEKRILGKTNKFWPAIGFGAGFVVWSIFFSWLGRTSKSKEQLVSDDSVDPFDENEAGLETPEQSVEEISGQTQPKPTFVLCLIWTFLMVAGFWGIVWAMVLTFYFRDWYAIESGFLRAYLVAAAICLLAVSCFSLSQVLYRNLRSLRTASLFQCLSFLAMEPLGIFLGLTTFGLSYLKLEKDVDFPID